MRNSNWPGYRVAAWVGIGLLVAATAYTLAEGRWQEAAPLIGFIVVAVLFIRLEDRLPTLFDFLFVIAALLNAGGWAFKWYNTIAPYDEVAHGFTTFALTLAFGYLTYRRMLTSFHSQSWLFAVTIASFGIMIGTLWEIAEWISDFFVSSSVVESIPDIMDDLLMDSIGAVCAGLLSLWPLHDDVKAGLARSASAASSQSRAESPAHLTHRP